MSRTCLMLTRLLLSGWVGASLIFILITIFIATSNQFDSEVQDKLGLIRFPIFYRLAFWMVGLSYLFHLGSFKAMKTCRIRWVVGCFLIPFLFVLGVMDYTLVTEPMLEMIDPPGMARPQRFREYHEASERMGSVIWGLSLITALMINWPIKPPRSTTNPDDHAVT